MIGLKVVTGEGNLVTTGSAAGIHRPSPFHRNYGPDLTGMFLSDSGAFGIKVEATLQLVPAAQAIEVASFTFADTDALMRCLGMVGAEALASECFALDPNSVRDRLAGSSTAKDLQTLKSVLTAAPSRFQGLRDVAAIAIGGRGFARGSGYLLNCVTEGRNRAEALERLQRVRDIAREQGGEETVSSIPRVLRATPFPEVSGLLTPTGRRINWVHTVVPNSRGAECFNATEAVYRRHQDTMNRLKINYGYFLTTNGPSGVGIETLIKWSDAPLPIHDFFMKATGPYKARPADPEARKSVAGITKDIIRCWSEIGGVHLQIGKKYPYFKTREPETRRLVEQFKSLVDPKGVINPGNLLPTADRAP